MTDDAAERHAVDLHTDRPHPARVYDYLLGGKDNFEADRIAAPARACSTRCLEQRSVT